MVQSVERNIEGFINNRKVLRALMLSMDLQVSTPLPVFFFLSWTFWYDYLVNAITVWESQDNGGVATNEDIENDIGIVISLFEFIRLTTFHLHQTCKGHHRIDINQLTSTLLCYPTLMSLTSIIPTSSLTNLTTLESSTICTANILLLYIIFPNFPAVALQRIKSLVATHHGSPSGRNWRADKPLAWPCASICQRHRHIYIAESRWGSLTMGDGFAALYTSDWFHFVYLSGLINT